MQLSAVVLTKNNEKTLSQCLSSLNWCDEVVIIDDNSTDKTKQIALKFKAKYILHPLKNDWSAQRNFALTQTQNDWVLFVDSDEIVSPKLKQEIITLTKHPISVNGYYLKRQDICFGRKLKFGETSRVRILRLASKKAGNWTRAVHETWDIKGKVTTLKYPLIHHREITITDFLNRLNLYTSLESPTFAWLDLLKPKLKFIFNFFIFQGYKDKMAGFIMAYLMSLHSLVVRVKSWEKKYL